MLDLDLFGGIFVNLYVATDFWPLFPLTSVILSWPLADYKHELTFICSLAATEWFALDCKVFLRVGLSSLSLTGTRYPCSMFKAAVCSKLLVKLTLYKCHAMHFSNSETMMCRIHNSTEIK